MRFVCFFLTGGPLSAMPVFVPSWVDDDELVLVTSLAANDRCEGFASMTLSEYCACFTTGAINGSLNVVVWADCKNVLFSLKIKHKSISSSESVHGIMNVSLRATYWVASMYWLTTTYFQQLLMGTVITWICFLYRRVLSIYFPLKWCWWRHLLNLSFGANG